MIQLNRQEKKIYKWKNRENKGKYMITMTGESFLHIM